jgi:hypothetical protein
VNELFLSLNGRFCAGNRAAISGWLSQFRPSRQGANNQEFIVFKRQARNVRQLLSGQRGTRHVTSVF